MNCLALAGCLVGVAAEDHLTLRSAGAYKNLDIHIRLSRFEIPVECGKCHIDRISVHVVSSRELLRIILKSEHASRPVEIESTSHVTGDQTCLATLPRITRTHVSVPKPPILNRCYEWEHGE